MIVLDVETTGTDPVNHSIISLTAHDFFNPENRFHCECSVAPGCEIDEEALKVNGFTREQLARPELPTEAELVKHYSAWKETVYDQTIAGENPWFDASFVREAAKRAGIEIHIGRRCVDLHTLSYFTHLVLGLEIPLEKKRSALSLGLTAEKLGLHEGEAPHTSQGDVDLTARSLRKLLTKFQAMAR